MRKGIFMMIAFFAVMIMLNGCTKQQVGAPEEVEDIGGIGEGSQNVDMGELDDIESELGELEQSEGLEEDLQELEEGLL